MQATLDNLGRIALPKPVRVAIGLEPGAVLDVEVREGEIVLHPADAGTGVEEQDGLLVVTRPVPGDISRLLVAHRDRRVWPTGSERIATP